MQRVLVIDDDAQVLSLTARWLRDAGYEVETSSDFVDAQVTIRLSAPEIIVADVRLGAFNGIQLGLIAQNVRRDVRVVFITGWDDPVLRRDAASIGAPFVLKPLSPHDLLSAIRPGVERCH